MRIGRNMDGKKMGPGQVTSDRPPIFCAINFSAKLQRRVAEQTADQPCLTANHTYFPSPAGTKASFGRVALFGGRSSPSGLCSKRACVDFDSGQPDWSFYFPSQLAAKMHILTQFLLRMSFGLALGMAITSPKQVTSGYYRNHLYVLLGLNVLATLIALSAPTQFALWPPLAASVLSYVGSVVWLYEKPRPGIVLLWILAIVSLVGGWLAMDLTRADSTLARVLTWLDVPTSGLVLGITMAAMLLGHWYLNSPTMALAPLKKLVAIMGAVIALRALVCGLGLVLEWQHAGTLETIRLMLLAVRWLFGIVLAGLVTVMAWQTLKIPNTQSATGILYVGVIATFLGELVSLMLTSNASYPL